MKITTKFAWVFAAAIASVMLGLAFLFTKTNVGESFFCQFRSFSPADVDWEGPIDIGTEWTRLAAPSVLKSVPFNQEIWLLATPDTYSLHSPVKQSYSDFDRKSFWYLNGEFEHRQTAKRTAFQVKVEDINGRSVQLMQTSVGQETTGQEPRPALIFDLYHPDWERMIFHPDFQSNSIYVRASQPFTLNAIKWRADYYNHHPCKTWEEVQPETIFNFDELPPPARSN